MRKGRILLLVLVLSSIAVGYGAQLLFAYRVVQSNLISDEFNHLPHYVQNAAPEVQVAYQFAIDHPETLKQIPCYCGCEKTLGHKHNLDCYISGFNPDGSVADYRDHAVYCAVCVDTTQMVIKMTGEGKSIQEIHDAVDAKYSFAESQT